MRTGLSTAERCGGVAVIDGDTDAVLLVERAVPPGEGAWTFPAVRTC